MGTHRETRVDVALRSFWSRAFLALVLVALAGAVWWRAFLYFRDELLLAFLAYPVGIGVAVGVWMGIGYIFRRAGPRPTPIRQSTGNLARHALPRLESLDPLTTRLHPIGDPFPVVVVTLHGAFVVTAQALPGTMGVDGDITTLDGRPVNDPAVSEVRRLALSLRDVLVRGASIDLPVHGLVIVDDGTVVPPTVRAGDRLVQFCHLDQLEEVVEFGPATSTQAFQRAFDTVQRWRPAASPVRG